AMFAELERAWAELDADPDVRVIVNTGNGDAFQTGLDVRQLATDRVALREQSRRTRDFDLRLTAWHCSVWKPVVAAVNGVGSGAGRDDCATPVGGAVGRQEGPVDRPRPTVVDTAIRL